MLLIIAHHYVVNSGLTTPIYTGIRSAHSIFLLLFGAWGKTGINCFVSITGYFMCKTRISAKKFAKLVFLVMFYGKSQNPKLITIKMICDGLGITLGEFFSTPEFDALVQEIK